MLIIELANILAVHVVQHGDVASVTIAPPALLPIDEDWVFAGVVLAEPLRDLTLAVDRAPFALPAD